LAAVCRGLVEEDAQLVRSVAKVIKEAALHLQDRQSRSVAAEVECGDDSTGGGEDRHGERAEADFVLLIHQGVAVATHVA